MYDVCDKNTFNRVHFWYNELKKNELEDYPILIVGNKIDGNRVVNTGEAQELAKSLNCLYTEMSVKTGQNTFYGIKKFTEHLYSKKEELTAFTGSALEEFHLNLRKRQPKPREQMYECCVIS